MANQEQYDINSLKPGDIVRLPDTNTLHFFETQVADLIYKRLYKGNPIIGDPAVAWEGRVPLDDLLRPPAYRGDFTDIKVLVLDQPYNRLINAAQEGWMLKRERREGKEGGIRKPSTDPLVINSYWGFELEALASTTGRSKDVLPRIHARLWLGSVPLKHMTYTRKDGTTTPFLSLNTRTTGGSPIRRHVSEIHNDDVAAFDELLLASRAIALEVERRGQENVLIVPMQD